MQEKRILRVLLAATLIVFMAMVVAGCSSAKNSAPAPKKPGKAPAITHAIDPQKQCLDCHQDGKDGARKSPHLAQQLQPGQTCTSCHQPKKP